VAPTAESKAPDKYTINKNLVVNLNDPVVKPVKRENSHTTNATHVTGVTASTAGTHNTKNNAAFYSTQYKAHGSLGKQIDLTHPATTTGAHASISIANNESMGSEPQKGSQKGRQQQQLAPPGTAGSMIDNPKATGGRFREMMQTGMVNNSQGGQGH
jgi:hypothetical protein